MYFYTIMKLIGLTGGIGSGKTLIAGIFQTLGIPVYSSDSRAKDLMKNDQQVRQEILKVFGEAAYDRDQNLNRQWIADQVFNNHDLLQRLNDIVHPAVFRDLASWAQEKPQTKAPYLLQESAILFEENLYRRMTANILVVAPEDIRIERVIHRDGRSRQAVEARMKNQWADDKKIPMADYIIYNDGERPLISQIMDIDQMIRTLLNDERP